MPGKESFCEVAVRAVDLTKSLAAMASLLHEACVLHHLEALPCVAQLAGQGFMLGGLCYFLATGLVPGHHPLDGGFTAHHRVLAHNALSDIHARGILHGDVRNENILIVSGHSTDTVIFIDFGQAISVDGLDGKHVQARFTEEHGQLDEVLYLLD